MSVKLISRVEGDVTIVDTSGRLTLGEGTSLLRDKLRELVDGGSNTNPSEHGRRHLPRQFGTR